MDELYSFEDAFFMSLFYNGYEDIVEELIDYLSSTKDDKPILRPAAIDELTIEDEIPIELLWMILVIKFGNYGTSPRSGWIEQENKDRAISLLKKNYETHMSPI